MTDPNASNSTPGSSIQAIIILVTATLLLVALGYTVSPVLSPFVLLGAIIYLLYPLRHDPLSGRLIWLSVFLFTIWFVHSLLGILAPFIIAFLVAYVLNPLVTNLHRRGLPRWASSLLAVLLFLAICPGLLIVVMPVAVEQFQGIVSSARQIAEDLSRLLESGTIFNILSDYGVPVERLQELIKREFTPGLESVLTALFQGLFGFVTSVSALAMHIINIVIIPFLVFYLLMDFPAITDRIHRLVPPDRREQVGGAARTVDEVLGKYFRGAILVALIQGTISATVLWLIGVKYALILGIMTGLLNFIPYVGLITSLVVSSIVALFSGEPVLAKVGGVVVLYLSQKLFEATVLGPKIVGAKVGLHPVLLILCLLMFGYFLGFVGLLVAVPATALIITAVRNWESSHKVIGDRINAEGAEVSQSTQRRIN